MRTGSPELSARGIRQFGYSWSVPGWFCVLRSPTQSTRATPMSAEGVRTM